MLGCCFVARPRERLLDFLMEPRMSGRPIAEWQADKGLRSPKELRPSCFGSDFVGKKRGGAASALLA